MKHIKLFTENFKFSDNQIAQLNNYSKTGMDLDGEKVVNLFTFARKIGLSSADINFYFKTAREQLTQRIEPLLDIVSYLKNPETGEGITFKFRVKLYTSYNSIKLIGEEIIHKGQGLTGSIMSVSELDNDLYKKWNYVLPYFARSFVSLNKSADFKRVMNLYDKANKKSMLKYLNSKYFSLGSTGDIFKSVEKAFKETQYSEVTEQFLEFVNE